MALSRQRKNKQPVLLIGDIIFDLHHFAVDSGRVSHEAAVPMGIHAESKRSWGGAGLVARNMLALGVPVTFCTTVGKDSFGAELMHFSHPKLTKHFFTEDGRSTIVKERFLINGEKVLRWNRGDSTVASKETQARMLKAIRRALPRSSAVFISDYRHGCLSRDLATTIIRDAHKLGKRVYVDSQVVGTKPNHRWYRGADVICLNEDEARAVYPAFSRRSLRASVDRIQKILKAHSVIVKLGKDGSVTLTGSLFMETSGQKVRAVDATGAGDAFFAALATHTDLSEAALRAANEWGALATTVAGTEPPTRAMMD